jgi:hypothetical protein
MEDRKATTEYYSLDIILPQTCSYTATTAVPHAIHGTKATQGSPDAR